MHDCLLAVLNVCTGGVGSGALKQGAGGSVCQSTGSAHGQRPLPCALQPMLLRCRPLPTKAAAGGWPAEADCAPDRSPAGPRLHLTNQCALFYSRRRRRRRCAAVPLPMYRQSTVRAPAVPGCMDGVCGGAPRRARCVQVQRVSGALRRVSERWGGGLQSCRPWCGQLLARQVPHVLKALVRRWAGGLWLVRFGCRPAISCPLQPATRAAYARGASAVPAAARRGAAGLSGGRGVQLLRGRRPAVCGCHRPARRVHQASCSCARHHLACLPSPWHCACWCPDCAVQFDLIAGRRLDKQPTRPRQPCRKCSVRRVHGLMVLTMTDPLEAARQMLPFVPPSVATEALVRWGGSTDLQVCTSADAPPGAALGYNGSGGWRFVSTFKALKSCVAKLSFAPSRALPTRLPPRCPIAALCRAAATGSCRFWLWGGRCRAWLCFTAAAELR